jgi:alpha-tubulin suppressor-like RCC1 family protein
VSQLGPHVVDVAPGGNHTCAKTDDETVWCWGHGRYGQLGLPVVGQSHYELEPIEMKELAGVTIRRLASGEAHSCAITGDTSLLCWGINEVGQLGIGTTSLGEYVPQQPLIPGCL